MNFLRLLLFSQGFLKGMIFYLRFRETHEQVVAENETLRKKLDESQTKIRWLESKAEASQMMYECFRKEHGTTYGKFISAREEASRLNARLSDVTTELGACRSKVDTLSQSLLAVKTKFRKAKDKLREYKTKARSFYWQLSFASWGRDTGFYMGYLGGFETLKDWVRKPENIPKIDTISSKDVAPLKQAISKVSSVGRKEMPDCRRIKRMGFRPHLIYDPETRSRAQLPPRVDRPEESDVDSVRSVTSSTESWDRPEDGDELYS
jgi:hypothetical protein